MLCHGVHSSDDRSVAERGSVVDRSRPLTTAGSSFIATTPLSSTTPSITTMSATAGASRSTSADPGALGLQYWEQFKELRMRQKILADERQSAGQVRKLSCKANQ